MTKKSDEGNKEENKPQHKKAHSSSTSHIKKEPAKSDPAPEPAVKAPEPVQEPKPAPAEPVSESVAPPPQAHPDKKEQAMDMGKKAAAGAGKAASAGYNKIKTTILAGDANIKRVDKFLDWARQALPIEKLDGMSDWFVKYGHCALIAAQFITALFFILSALRLPGTLSHLIHGAGLIVLLGVLQYSADKFLGADKDLIESSPSKLRSPAFLDSVAVLSIAGGVVGFVYKIIEAAEMNAGLTEIGASPWGCFWEGCAILLIGTAFAWVAMNPSTLNIKMSKSVRAGEEAIGILSFLAKTVVKGIPILFGAGAFLGMFGMIYGLWPLLKSKNPEFGLSAYSFVAGSACLPFLGYVFFMLYHLTIDLLRAILVLPGKLDNLK